MIDKILEFALRQRVIVLLGAVACAVVAVYGRRLVRFIQEWILAHPRLTPTTRAHMLTERLPAPSLAVAATLLAIAAAAFVLIYSPRSARSPATSTSCAPSSPATISGPRPPTPPSSRAWWQSVRRA